MPDSASPARHPRPVPALISSGGFLAQLDATIVAMPDMQARLGVRDLQRIVAGYTLAPAGLLFLGDRFDHRRLLLCGLTAFATTSACACLRRTSKPVGGANPPGRGGIGTGISVAGADQYGVPGFAVRANAIGAWADGLPLTIGPPLASWSALSGIFRVTIRLGAAASISLRLLHFAHPPQGTHALDPVLLGTSIAALPTPCSKATGTGDARTRPGRPRDDRCRPGRIRALGTAAPRPMWLFGSRAVLAARTVNLLGPYGSVFVPSLYLQQVSRPRAAGLRFLALNVAIVVFSYLADVMASPQRWLVPR